MDDTLRCKIVALHQRGWSQRMIAHEVGCHQTTVGKAIRSYGLPANGWDCSQARLRRKEQYRLLCLRKAVRSLGTLSGRARRKRPDKAAEQSRYARFVSRHGGYHLGELKQLKMSARL